MSAGPVITVQPNYVDLSAIALQTYNISGAKALNGTFGDRAKDIVEIRLIGAFGACLNDGSTLDIVGKKNQAILAMLACEPSGRRSRHWLQYKLWSERGHAQGAASLRQALTQIRRALGPTSNILKSTREFVELDMSRVVVDTGDLDGLLSDTPRNATREFLEGLEIADPEFDEWVRLERSFWRSHLEDAWQRIEGIANTTAPIKILERPVFSVPCVAVQSFQVDPSNPVDAHISEGIADQIIDQFSRIGWLMTISRRTTFSPGLDKLDAAQFGEKVGADFVLIGELRLHDDVMHLTVELMRYPGSVVLRLMNFALPRRPSAKSIDEVAIEIAGNLSDSIGQVREQQATSHASDSKEITDLIWLGRWHMNCLTRKDFEHAIEIFGEVIRRDPGNAEAHINLTIAKLWDIWTRRGGREEILRVRKQAQNAIKLDVSDSRGYWIVGMALTWLRDTVSARYYIEESIRLCPSAAFAHVQLGTHRIYSGTPAKAYAPLDTALRLSPFDRQRFNIFGEYSMAALLAEDFDHAVDMAEQSLLLRPGYWYARMTKCLAHQRAGRRGEALASARKLFKASPDFSAGHIRWLPFVDAERPTRMIEEIAALCASAGDLEFDDRCNNVQI